LAATKINIHTYIKIHITLCACTKYSWQD